LMLTTITCAWRLRTHGLFAGAGWVPAGRLDAVIAGAGTRSLNAAWSLGAVVAELLDSAWNPARAVTATAVPSMAALSLPGLGIRVVTTPRRRNQPPIGCTSGPRDVLSVRGG
jgi:hypothetical protein